MLKLNVWYRDEDGNRIKTTLRNLEPERYMCSWSFDRVLKYAEEELYQEDINEEDVIAFEIENKRAQWWNIIKRPMTKQEFFKKFNYDVVIKTTKKKLKKAGWEPYEDEYEKCIGEWVTLIPDGHKNTYRVRIFGNPDDWWREIYEELCFLKS